MKKAALFALSAINFLGFSQVFEVPAGTRPYEDIIEWKGMGSILMSSDPNTKQVNLTLANSELKSVWDQKFIPKHEKYYYISSENARYVYFLDNLQLDGGKVYFNQLNSAGNVKSTSVSISSAVKSIGVSDYNDLELINCVVTDKALVHHFRYHDKGSKAIVDIATFITHHNFLCYPVVLGSVPEANMKEEHIGNWEYVGFTDDQICFAARDYQNKNSGWSVKEYTSKGKDLKGYFINGPKDLIPIENIGFGTTGKYYLNERYSVERGLLTYINNQFYMVGGQRKSETGAEITLFKLVDNKWVDINRMNLNYFIEKKNLKLGIYTMNEGVGYHLDHNGYNKVSLISFAPQKETAHNDFTERTIFNPSSVFERKEKEEFNVILPTGLLTFNTGQLGKEGAVEFEFKGK
jgi:hypothetical protein